MHVYILNNHDMKDSHSMQYLNSQLVNASFFRLPSTNLRVQTPGRLIRVSTFAC